MMNSINNSYYFNYSKANKYYNKSDEKQKDIFEDTGKENKKENNTLVPMHRAIRDIKKNDNKIRVIQADQKDKKEKENKSNKYEKENKENNNVEKVKIKESQIKNQIKLNKERNENTENKENDVNSQNKQIIEKQENKENKNPKEINDDKNNEENKNDNNEYIDDDDKIKIKYFDISKIINAQIPKEYINIIYYNLLKEEEKGINPKPDYTYMSRQNEINDKMRSILVDWIIDVHFKFGFTDETLFMTISIIDRYLSICPISRTNFQLLGITALMIACKHEEIDLPKIDDFIYITDNAYVKEEVIKMEEDVLIKLNFEFLYPSPIKFFEYLSVNFNFSKKHHMMGKYLMESFLLDVKNAKYKPSIISCACTYIVMKFFKMANYHDSYDKKFYILDEAIERYSEHNIKECAKDICLLVDNINKTNYHACLKKYSKPEQEKVSIIIMNN